MCSTGARASAPVWAARAASEVEASCTISWLELSRLAVEASGLLAGPLGQRGLLRLERGQPRVDGPEAAIERFRREAAPAADHPPPPP